MMNLKGQLIDIYRVKGYAKGQERMKARKQERKKETNPERNKSRNRKVDSNHLTSRGMQIQVDR